MYEQDAKEKSTWRSVVITDKLYEIPEEEEQRAYASLAANAQFAPDLGVWGIPFEETARTDKTLKSEFKRACEHNDESMTDELETMVRKYVDDHGPISNLSRSQWKYVPNDPGLREIYQVCLDVAVNGTHGPTIYQRRHASAIAQKTQQISKDELADAMTRLRRNGYATIGAMPPELQAKSAKRWRNRITKPPAVDPEQ